MKLKLWYIRVRRFIHSWLDRINTAMKKREAINLHLQDKKRYYGIRIEGGYVEIFNTVQLAEYNRKAFKNSKASIDKLIKDAVFIIG